MRRYENHKDKLLRDKKKRSTETKAEVDGLWTQLLCAVHPDRRSTAGCATHFLHVHQTVGRVQRARNDVWRDGSLQTAFKKSVNKWTHFKHSHFTSRVLFPKDRGFVQRVIDFGGGAAVGVFSMRWRFAWLLDFSKPPRFAMGGREAIWWWSEARFAICIHRKIAGPLEFTNDSLRNQHQCVLVGMTLWSHPVNTCTLVNVRGQTGTALKPIILFKQEDFSALISKFLKTGLKTFYCRYHKVYHQKLPRSYHSSRFRQPFHSLCQFFQQSSRVHCGTPHWTNMFPIACETMDIQSILVGSDALVVTHAFECVWGEVIRVDSGDGRCVRRGRCFDRRRRSLIINNFHLLLRMATWNWNGINIFPTQVCHIQKLPRSTCESVVVFVSLVAVADLVSLADGTIIEDETWLLDWNIKFAWISTFLYNDK